MQTLPPNAHLWLIAFKCKNLGCTCTWSIPPTSKESKFVKFQMDWIIYTTCHWGWRFSMILMLEWKGWSREQLIKRRNMERSNGAMSIQRESALTCLLLDRHPRLTFIVSRFRKIAYIWHQKGLHYTHCLFTKTCDKVLEQYLSVIVLIRMEMVHTYSF